MKGSKSEFPNSRHEKGSGREDRWMRSSRSIIEEESIIQDGVLGVCGGLNSIG